MNDEIAATDADIARLEAYIGRLTGALGHADRVFPFRSYLIGTMLPGKRKRIEPMSARLDPEVGIAFRTKPQLALSVEVHDADGSLKLDSDEMRHDIANAIRSTARGVPKVASRLGFCRVSDTMLVGPPEYSRQVVGSKHVTGNTRDHEDKEECPTSAIHVVPILPATVVVAPAAEHTARHRFCHRKHIRKFVHGRSAFGNIMNCRTSQRALHPLEVASSAILRQASDERSQIWGRLKPRLAQFPTKRTFCQGQGWN